MPATPGYGKEYAWHPVVHFESIGKNSGKLRNYFGELFSWQFDTSSPVAEAVSGPTDYGFVERITTPDGAGIPGGVGGGVRHWATSSSTSACRTSRPPGRGRAPGRQRQMGPERAPT